MKLTLGAVLLVVSLMVPTLASAQTETQTATPTETATPETTTTTTPPPTEAATTAAPSATTKPAAPSKPAGFDDALKLYAARKYAPAAAKFEAIVKSGKADSDTHYYLGACYQATKKYDAALKEYDWVSKNAPLISQKNKAITSAAWLRNMRAGICPNPCLKLSTPGWTRKDGHLWFTWRVPNGTQSASDAHVGQVFVMEKGYPVNKGTCPVCHGTGKVAPLR